MNTRCSSLVCLHWNLTQDGKAAGIAWKYGKEIKYTTTWGERLQLRCTIKCLKAGRESQGDGFFGISGHSKASVYIGEFRKHMHAQDRMYTQKRHEKTPPFATGWCIFGASSKRKLRQNHKWSKYLESLQAQSQTIKMGTGVLLFLF